LILLLEKEPDLTFRKVDEMMPLMPFWAESIADSLIMAAVSSVNRPGPGCNASL
jgi:hypothetical protein